jgi:hypothetical protein
MVIDGETPVNTCLILWVQLGLTYNYVYFRIPMTCHFAIECIRPLWTKTNLTPNWKSNIFGEKSYETHAEFIEFNVMLDGKTSKLPIECQ